MDGERMTTSSGAGGEAERDRVEELMRVNAELAAELRACRQGAPAPPRSGRAPAARSLIRLQDERDSLAQQLAESQAALAAAEVALAETSANRDGLERQNREMAAEIARLSAGMSGIVRRLRGRLLSRGADGAGPGPGGR